MAQFIVNPRRGPRARVRCRTAVVFQGGTFECETEDIGSRGCQLVSPKFMRRGDAVQLTVSNEKIAEPLRAAGQVAWVSAQAPFRVGIAFDEASVRDGARWFEKVAAAYPGLAGWRVPQRIPTDAVVYLGPPPRFLLDFTADEANLLRAIGSGVRIDELQARLRDRWPAAQLALFSLLARQAVTLVRGQAFQPDAWKKVLAEVEGALAVESLGRSNLAAPLAAPILPPALAAASPPAARRAAAPGSSARGIQPPNAAPRRPETSAVPPWETRNLQNPSRMLELPDDDGPPLELELELDTARSSPACEQTDGAHVDAKLPGAPRGTHDLQGAGGGWRKASGRSAEAQGAYDRALAEVQAGNTAGALTLLRRALQLAPGDPEIAGTLGTLAFKDREPGTR